MRTADLIGRALVAAGVDHVFGVVGSGNFHLTNAMIGAGARFVAARHEGGAATMADAYARTAGVPAALTVHQGCGLTNAMTGIAEAAKSRTPLIVLAPQATEATSNFHVDQAAMARAVGAEVATLDDPGTAAADVVAAVARARDERRTVLLNLPLAVLAAQSHETTIPALPVPPPAAQPSTGDAAALATALGEARRPVFVVGRGGRGAEARESILALADRCGALLATSAVATGLFAGETWSIGVSGGFASPLTAQLIAEADLVVGWGCALNMWTMRHGRLIADGAVVAQVDDTPDALGAHRPVDLPVLGDVAATARAVIARLGGDRRPGYRSRVLAGRLRTELRWRDVAYEDVSTGERIDPRTLSSVLDDLLPDERVVAVDSGNFMGYPAMFLDVPDERGSCFTQAFQSIGLGLATAIGAALAQPDRLPVAALGDGGALMAAAELDTVRRLGLAMVVVVYNDDAYGAEVHHFAGEDVSTVTFPPTDIAAIGRGYGFDAVTVHGRTDLDAVAGWLAGPRDRPLLIDAKVVADEPAWWLAEAFGH